MCISLSARVTVTAAALSMLLGLKCPVNSSPEGGGGSSTGVAGQDLLDVGGQAGAFWQIKVDPRLLVTLRAPDRQGGSKVSDGRMPLRIGSDTIDLAGFCWRADTICPQHLLRSQTRIHQSAASVLFSFNPRGSLASYPPGAVLAGALDGPEITLPLTIGQGICSTLKGSTLLATAYVDDQGAHRDASRAIMIRGKITLVYGGDCLTRGGSAALESAARVELVVNFSAKRN